MEKTDRRKATGPFLVLSEAACVVDWELQQAAISATVPPVAAIEADPELPAATTPDAAPVVIAPDVSHPGKRKDDIEDLVDQHLNALDKKVKSKAERNRIAKDVRQRRSMLRHFTQAISAKNLLELTQLDLSQYDEIMDTIPKEHGKSEVDRKRTVHELVERAEDLPEEQVGLSAATKNRNWGIVKKFLRFARAKHGVVPAASLYFEDLYAKVEDGEANIRLAFTDLDVARLSEHPV